MTTEFARILSELSDATASDGITWNEHSPFHLATLADCYGPDSIDSPGAVFLARVAQDVAEHVNQYAGTPEDGDDWPLIVGELSSFGDVANEIADSAVPIYTHERWQTFVDLGAYNEDASELGATADDLTGAAGVALYIIAERLVHALAAELSEALDSDAAEREAANA